MKNLILTTLVAATLASGASAGVLVKTLDNSNSDRSLVQVNEYASKYDYRECVDSMKANVKNKGHSLGAFKVHKSKGDSVWGSDYRDNNDIIYDKVKQTKYSLIDSPYFNSNTILTGTCTYFYY